MKIDIDLSRFDRDDDFSAREIACLMSGFDPHTENSDVRIGSDLKRLLEGYFSAFRHVETSKPQRIGTETPPSYLFSLDLKQWWVTKLHIYGCYPNQKWIPDSAEVEVTLKEFRAGFPRWNEHVRADFSQERFARIDIHNWIFHNKFKSLYLFLPDQLEKNQKETAKGQPVTNIYVHRINAPHRDVIDPIISIAQAKCEDPMDTAQVFAELSVLALAKKPPFTGVVGTNGLQYMKAGVTDPYFTRNALNKRLHPETRGPRGKKRQ